MEFRSLGPLEVADDDGAFGVEAQKPRALLALLLLHANGIVPAERLIEARWDGSPPASATKLLRTYAPQLRSELGSESILMRGPAIWSPSSPASSTSSISRACGTATTAEQALSHAPDKVRRKDDIQHALG